MEPSSERLKEFLFRYESAFNAFDTDAIAKAFADTCMITTPEDVLLVRNDGQLRTIINGITSRYKAIGVKGVKVASLTEMHLDSSHSLAKVQWDLLRDDGTGIVSFDVTYLVRTTDDGSAIILLMPHNEEERLREKGLFEESRDARSP